jgi:hypothetical protein
MSISDIRNKIKHILKNIVIFMARTDTLLAIVIFSTAISSFYLGVLSGSTDQKTSKIVFNQVQAQDFDKSASGKEVGIQTEEYSGQNSFAIFASRNGTKYYYTWCKSGNRIKAANRVYYDTKEQAEATGKTLASGCQHK